MKKAISWILIVAIMLGFVSMIAFSVFATSYVERVYITTPQFQAGDAITTDFSLDISGAELVEIKGWYDEYMQPASGTFIANEIYYLKVELAAPEGYAFSERETTVFPNGYGMYTSYVDPADESRMLLDIEFNFNPIQVQRIYVEEMPESIEPGPATAPEGMNLMGPATIVAARWVDMDKNPVELLEEGKAYYLELTFAPESGYEFRNWVDIFGRGGMPYESKIVSKEQAKAWFAYSLLPGVGEVVLTVSGLEAGAPVSGVQVTLPADSKVNLRSVLIWDEEAGEAVESGNFERGKCYGITYILEPKEGYNIEDYSVSLETNLSSNSWSSNVWNGLLQVSSEFDLTSLIAYDVEVADLPQEIQPGPAPLPEISVGDEAVFVDVCWLDTNDQPVTAFRDGEEYYLEVTVAPVEGLMFQDDLQVYGDFYIEEHRIVSPTEAKIRFRYSLQPGVGEVTLTVTGLAEGAPISGVEAIVSADAKVTLTEMKIYDEEGNLLESGSFQKNCTYEIEYLLEAQSGYDPENGIDIELIGGETSHCVYYWVGKTVWLHQYFSTSAPVDTVELAVVEPVEGGSVADASVTVTKGQCTVDYQWIDTQTYEPAQGSFQKGHKYELSFTLYPEEGYVFPGGTKVQLNGEEIDCEFGLTGDWCDGWKTYSFLEKITRVELNWVPTSLTIGDALPKAPADENANYTAQSGWYVFPQGIACSQVTKNGSYLLEVGLSPKEGYEFADNVEVIIGGKAYTYFDNYGDYLYLIKTYNVGLQLIDRVDVTLTEPKAGMTPQSGVFDEKNYVFSGDVWLQCETDSLENAEFCETFEAGNYHYYSCLLEAAEGYAFADDVAIYVNGKPVTVAWNFNFGFTYDMYIDLGKLQDAGSVGTGDLDGNGQVDEDDAIYLLQHVLMPDMFPVEGNVDFDKNGTVDEDDAIYLLQHVLMPETFPL